MLPGHWCAAAEALALETLSDKELSVRMSAARALAKVGSAEAAVPVLAMLQQLSARDPTGGVLRYDLLFAIAKRASWMADARIKKAFDAHLNESDRHMIQMATASSK